jgi:hypothetical protein
LAVVAVLALCRPLAADPILLSDVPAYNWYHGCGPTAAAMIIGYWDLHGYPNLFQAQGNDVYLTANVQDQISSPAHNAKYDPTPDDPNLATPPYTSIADWFQTSVDPMTYGGSLYSNAPIALAGYAAYEGYTFKTSNIPYVVTWTFLENEVNAGRPILLLVDSDGDGLPDHFVPAFGYDDRGTGGKWYACYTTWSEDETPVWYQFQNDAVGNVFGVYGSTQVVPQPIPEPLTLAILSLGAVVVLGKRFRNRA